MPAQFPDILIGENSRKISGTRILMASFGEGYDQRIKDGLNATMERWELSFQNYDIDEIDTLVDFFDGLESINNFLWTPPFENQEKQWIQEGDYTVSFNGPLTKSLSVTIKRDYTL